MLMSFGGCERPYLEGNNTLLEIEKKLSMIKKGSSTKNDILTIFGKPLAVRSQDSKEEWVYQLNQGITDFWGTEVTKRDLLGLTFNKKGTLISIEKENYNY